MPPLTVDNHFYCSFVYPSSASLGEYKQMQTCILIPFLTQKVACNTFLVFLLIFYIKYIYV